MTRRLLAVSGVVISAALASGCGTDHFPVTPTPVATSAVVVQGNKYQGIITLSTGVTTSFNMTLMARELAGAAQVTVRAANTPTVTGSFETGSGLTGTVQGTLTGSLDDGVFDGSLTASSAGRASEQRYSGNITTESAALAPGQCVQGTCEADGLTGAIQTVQTPTPTGPPPPPPCSYAISPATVSVPGTGGTGSTTVNTTQNCAWAAIRIAPWITITGAASGAGVGTVTFTVEANPGAQRSGTVQIANQVLTVVEAAGAAVSGPAITTQPQSQAITPGTAATLSVAATGAAPLSYQWYVGTSGTTTAPIAGATASSYTTPALTSTTSYWVRVTNAGGSADSTTAAITVSANPTPIIGSFTASPTSITAGQSATLAWSGITNATTCAINNGVGTVSCGNATATVSPTTTTTYTLTATGPGGSATATAGVAVGAPPQPSITSFTANPTMITAGQSATLAWSGIANATSCSIDNGVGTVPCSDGTRTVTPTATTTYTLTATGAAGTTPATGTAGVGVGAPPPPTIGSFAASPTMITAGQSSTLTWSGIANATSCAINNGVGTVPCSDGTRNVTPTATTTYTLTATGAAGTTPATRTATVTVGPPPPPTITSFTASPAMITAGQSSTLTWNGIANATSCAINNGVGTVPCSDGTRNVTPTATTTYTLTATGAAGTTPATRTATVTVVPLQQPTVKSFAANPTTIRSGQSATLTWAGIVNATSCSINNGVGTIPCTDGTRNVTPTATTTYTLTATGAAGTTPATATATVTVTTPSLVVTPTSGPLPITFTATGSNFTPNGSVTLRVIRVSTGACDICLTGLAINGSGGFTAPPFGFGTAAQPGMFDISAIEPATGIVSNVIRVNVTAAVP